VERLNVDDKVLTF